LKKNRGKTKPCLLLPVVKRTGSNIGERALSEVNVWERTDHLHQKRYRLALVERVKLEIEAEAEKDGEVVLLVISKEYPHGWWYYYIATARDIYYFV
jgi:hypothetical protein